MSVHFAAVLIFMLVAVGFVLGQLILGMFLRPKIPDPEKSSIYECGERPIGKAWVNFNPRFYVVALIFVLFEVEIALTFPVAAVLNDWIAAGNGGIAFWEIFAFIVVLSVGLGYCWAMGDLEWVKRIRTERAGVRTRAADIRPGTGAGIPANEPTAARNSPAQAGVA